MIFSRAPRAARRRAAGVSRGAACAAAAALLLTACSSGDDQDSSGGAEAKFVSGTGQIAKVEPADRVAAPDISGETLDGEKLSLSDYRGKVVVINVWGSWCSPCRAEAPNFKRVHDETKDKGVQFLGINTRDLNVANAQAFDRNFEIDYPSLYDPAGKLMLKFPKNSLPPQTIPSTLVLDREGRIAVRALKELTSKDLRDMIEPVLAEK